MFTGTSTTVRPASLQPEQRLDLGRAALVRLGEDRHRLRVDGVHPARRVVERAAERRLHPPPEQRRCRSSALGLGSYRYSGIALAADEPRADGDVGLARADDLEQARELVRPGAGRRRRRGRRRRSRARGRTRSRRRSRRAGLGSRRTRAPARRCSAAISAVRSVDPSSTTSTSAAGRPSASSSSTAGRLSSSFQAGMKTIVSGIASIVGALARLQAEHCASGARGQSGLGSDARRDPAARWPPVRGPRRSRRVCGSRSRSSGRSRARTRPPRRIVTRVTAGSTRSVTFPRLATRELEPAAGARARGQRPAGARSFPARGRRPRRRAASARPALRPASGRVVSSTSSGVVAGLGAAGDTCRDRRPERSPPGRASAAPAAR